MTASQPDLGRKRRMVLLAAAAGLVALGAALSLLAPDGTGSADVGQPPPVQPAPEGPDPQLLALLGPELADARRLGELRVLGIEGVVDGAIRLELQLPTGEPFRVEILRKDPAAPEGIAGTPGLSLYLVGPPGAPTPEEQAQAVVALAARIALQEQQGVPLPALRSLAERR